MTGSQTRQRRSASSSDGLIAPVVFIAITAVCLTRWTWSKSWLLSGSPILYLCLLLGQSLGNRAFGFIGLWAIFIALNLTYAICSTSWLLYWVFTASIYVITGFVCLAQFAVVGGFVRSRLRAILRSLHFVDDKVGFFDIPALEIDTEIDGLFVIRGVTISLSNLSITAHGVEVGIKLSDDMEIAIQCGKAEVRLFRGIWISDCFANLKGGKFEMTFGKLAKRTKDEDGDAVFVKKSELLKAASFHGDTRMFSGHTEKMKSVMTGGNPPRDSSARSGLSAMDSFITDNQAAANHYRERLLFIESTDAINEARTFVSSDERHTFQNSDSNMRAATCSQLHHKPSVPHPPQTSVKVTTLQNLSHPSIRRFIHRLPMLLRSVLYPLSYFHPIHLSSITTSASGAWIDKLLVDKVFRSYHITDSQIAHLKERLSAWLSGADFVVELSGISALAQVPFFPIHDIYCRVGFEDVLAYRSIPEKLGLKQVVRLGGANATFTLPSFLLPHHEHLLPPEPNTKQVAELKGNVKQAEGKPKQVLAEHELHQAQRDEANIQMSVHARLPACLDQELLDFVAALVKATKVVEMAEGSRYTSDDTDDDDDNDDDQSPAGESKHRVRRFLHGVTGGVKRRVVDGIVNDHWIAKLVGMVSKRLETAKGEIGYSGGIPIKLNSYRTGAMKVEGSKILP